MKLTFTTSLLLLTAASATSTDSGGLRSRRLSLFSTESSGKKKENGSAARFLAKGDKGEDKDNEGDGTGPANSNSKANKDKDKESEDKDSEETESKDKESKSSKAERTGNVVGGAKGGKSEFLKTEAARPYSGIDTVDDLYYFGETITGDFELNDEYLTEAALVNFNATHVQDFKFALFPYMGRPNCDGEVPVREVGVTIAEGGTEVPIDFTGTFSIDTDAEMMIEAGTGYDLYLLDHTGCYVMLGPEAVTVTQTPEVQKAEETAAKAKTEKANTARAKTEKIKTATKKTYKKQKKEIDAEKITVKSKEALSSDDYELTTDKEEYETGETITVSYNIIAAPAALEVGVPTSDSRRLKKKKYNKNDDVEKEEPVIPEGFNEVEELTEDDAASKPQPEVTADKPVEEQVEKPESDQPEPETLLQPDLETLLQPDPMVSEDGEESGEQQPEDAVPEDLAIEEQEEIDPSDITQYSLGVFMKMANPQGGKLPPIYQVPLCDSDSCSAEEISSGEITFDVDSLDTIKYGKGFDLWLLDGSGDGIAGPVFFSLDIDA